ncbi:DNA mismatch repair protein MutS [Candidatus Peregrinibacteria bacterium]|nr:DNA mismatch repair protein MutS [Candidatus Peregrinibacteria bacterium]
MATPMMKQYKEIKSQHEDCILFFRLGDFYEMFGDDAIVASKILDINLTSRNKGENKIPMCGIPHHAADNYLAKLTKHGKKVAICEQVSDPELPGIVKREVTRIVTPGTTFNDALLDTKTNNYLVSIAHQEGAYGIAYADVTTGECGATSLENYAELTTELSKINPSECILSPALYDSAKGKDLQDYFESICFFPFEHYRDSEEIIKTQFHVTSLAGFGLNDKPLAVKATGALLEYLKETQKRDLTHIKKVTYFSTSQYMPIDESTLRNLELLKTLRDQEKEGSLISIIDKTQTPMGGRMIKFWITHPLLDKKGINQRLEAVYELYNDQSLRRSIRSTLENIHDIERLIAKLSMGSGNGRDLLSLQESLSYIPQLKKHVKKCTSSLLQKLHATLDDLSSLTSLIEKAINPEAPLSLKDGNIINEGYNKQLDELKKISRDGKTFIKNLQEQERKRTSIQSLKVKYNKVFGYFIEVSKANLSLVPDTYIRKQTLVNAERYITPELKEYEEKILGAEEKIIQLEYDLFQDIRETVVSHSKEILENAFSIATLDVLGSFAFIAKHNHYCRPHITEDNGITIKQGRHPVVEHMSFSSDFIPNDTTLARPDNLLLLITGPNMGGKSTILRQTALIVLLAHIGSFVPAEKASIELVDRIFTRVGASDNLVKGQSTFMVEMQEAAFILNNATSKSLIILDEIGRGTSTYDGVSIAWAITEYIHNHIKAKTLFATHYHELISVVEDLKHAQNYSIAVKEKEDGVIFLYKLQKEGIDKSYGIEVAKRAGLPEEVIEKSTRILRDLEEEVVEQGIKKTLHNPKNKKSEDQLDLFGNAALLEEFERKTKGLKLLKEEIDSLDINSLTPLEALKKLDELKHNNM